MNRPRRPPIATGRRAGFAVVLAGFALALAGAILGDLLELAAIAILAAAAMWAGAGLGLFRVDGARPGPCLDGFAGGTLLGAAVWLLLPRVLVAATTADAIIGAAGVLLGLAGGRVLHRRVPDRTVRPRQLALTVHSAAAGASIGLLHAGSPRLGLWAGLVIVAHKLPAGYVLSRSAGSAGQAFGRVLWPACAVGIAAVPTAWAMASLHPGPDLAAVAVVFRGVAVGLFLYVGRDCVARDVADAGHRNHLAVVGGFSAMGMAGWLVAG